MIKFGVQFKPEFKDFTSLIKCFEKARELGFVSGWLYDHLYSIGGEPAMEGWTTLAALAAMTEHIRLGVLVTCNSFRLPQVIAKMASTVDLISKGRLEFGIGAGWYRKEYEAYGIPFIPYRERLNQLNEALQVIKLMWTENQASYRGKYYTIQDLKLQPKPLQKPYPPIWIGGNHSDVLSLVARHGNASNLVYADTQESKAKHQLLQEECLKLGKSYNNVIKSWHGSLFLANDSRKAREEAVKKKAASVDKKIRSLSDKEYLEKVIWGTTDQCIEKIQQFINVGFSYFILAEPSTLRIELQKFAQQVMPSFI